MLKLKKIKKKLASYYKFSYLCKKILIPIVTIGAGIPIDLG